MEKKHQANRTRAQRIETVIPAISRAIHLGVMEAQRDSAYYF
jgi:hypothetical protein